MAKGRATSVKPIEPHAGAGSQFLGQRHGWHGWRSASRRAPGVK